MPLHSCLQLLYLCFMDLKRAFDTGPRHILFAKLKHIGVKGKILNNIKDLFNNNEAVVRVGDYTSDPFTIETGVMQRSKLGPILFLIYTFASSAYMMSQIIQGGLDRSPY